MHRALLCALVVVSVGCTPGASSLSTGGSGVATTIDVDLTDDPGGPTPAGAGAGYKPLVTMVSVGTSIRFTNSDGFRHTASSIPGSTFPSAYPFTAAAADQSGTTLSGGFSSGSIAPGDSSQTLLADKAGTYIFGCFFHYGTPMRAMIVVQ
jgi:plastocyanin